MVINTMRRLAGILWLAVAVTAGVSAFSVDAARAERYAERIRSMYPRTEASEGERDLIAFVTEVVTEAGYAPRRIGFDRASSMHSFSHSIEVVVPGSLDATIVIATPLDHRAGTPPDDDGSASIAAALALIDALAVAETRNTYRFLFLSGEFRDAGENPLGTQRFLADYFPEGPHAMVYLDASQLPFRLETGGGGAVSPSWLIADTVDTAAQIGFDIVVRTNLNQVHRLGVSTSSEPLRRFLVAGIPGIYVGSGAVGLRPPVVGEIAVDLARFLAAWSARYEHGIPGTWDQHYLYFQIAGRQIVIGEQFFIVILLTVTLVTLLYALVFRRRFARYLRTIGRNVWNLPLLFLLIFGFLSASTYLIELFLRVRRFPTMWEYYPAAFVALKVLLSVLLFSVTAQFLRYLPLSKNGSFYSASALLVLFIDVLLFSAINLSFGYYFVWAYAAAFLFSVTRGKTAKTVTLLIAPLVLLVAAAEVVRVPEIRFIRTILLSTRGDLVLSFVTIPFLLMLIRLDFMIRHPIRGRRSFALRAASLGSGVGVATIIVFVVVSSPFSGQRPQPVHAVETIDYPNLTRSLEVSSPAPLGTLRVSFAGIEHQIDTRDRSWRVESPVLPDVLSARLVYSEFLDRDRAELTIDAPQPIEYLTVEFFSTDPVIVFDANFPFSVASDQRSARLFVGARPPLPLRVEYTVGGVPPGINITATSRVHPVPVRIDGRALDVSTELLIRTRFTQ
ncbi:MAG: hypothetical protein EA382_13180 [Spirochaetaceae bacterium]|nr:MAG: hypothetical protein EA382_13180 [Spirochaetaceae bacterium]